MRCRVLIVFSLVLALLQARAAELQKSEIPFEFKEGLLWIKASIPQSTEPLNLLLDTGAGVNVLNATTARLLRLKSGREVTVRGVESCLTGRWLKPVSVKASGITLPSNYLAVDLENLSHSCERPVDGLLGLDFFRERIVQIDFAGQKIRILPPNSIAKTDSFIPLEILSCGMRVAISVNACQQWMRLDTGCATALQWVTSPVLPADCNHQVAIGLTHLSIPQTKTVVNIAGHTFTDVPTGLHSKAIFPGEAGLLGNGLLSHFSKITIDSKCGRLFFDSCGRH